MAELLLLALIGSAAVGAAVSLRNNLGCRTTDSWVDLEIWFPYDLSADAATSFLRTLSTLTQPGSGVIPPTPAIIEVTGDAEGIRHRVSVASRNLDHVLSQLRAAIPGARMDVLEGRPALAVRAATELRLSGANAPLAIDPPESIARAMLASLQPLKKGEQIVVQWLVATTVRTMPADLSNMSAEARRALRRKLDDVAFLASVRIGTDAATDQRAHQLLRQVTAVFGIARAPGTSFQRRRLPLWWLRRQIEGRRAPIVLPVHLNVRELYALVGIPLGGPQIPGLRLGAARHLAVSRDIPEVGKVLARSNVPGAPRDIAVSVTNSLRHLHLIGPTSSGKSTLMMNLAIADAAEGRGLAIFDPAGDLIADFLDRLPANRVNDVILIDLNDRDRPVGFNVLSGSDDPELMTDQIVSVMRRIWADSWGNRLETLLRGSIRTLTETPGMTLAEVPLLLGDENVRRRITAKLDDPIVLEPLWAWFDSLSAAERATITSPVSNRIRAFTARRPLRNVIGQSSSSFTVREVLKEQRILLVSVAKGLVGEDTASLFGSLVLSQLWQAAMGRAALPANKRAPFACYVDECANFLNLPTSLADVLAEARKYAFGIVAAHQHLAQLPSELRQALLANARSRVVWQPSAVDARILAREFAPHLSVDDLKGLGPFEVAIQVCTGPNVATPATGRSLPPAPVTGQAEAARAASRERYGRPIEDVERELRARHGDQPGPGGIGTRKRS